MTNLEGALYETDALRDAPAQEFRAAMHAHPFQLGILRDGEICSPDEVEPGHPTWFSAPRFAKAAGAALCSRNPGTVGYDIVKVVNGHWRTVATEWIAS